MSWMHRRFCAFDGRVRWTCARVVLSAVPATGRVRGARFRRRGGGYPWRSYSDVARATLPLLDAASAPPLSACAALQYRRCSPAASATRRLDQVPVEPGISATPFATVLLRRTSASFSLATGRSPPRILPAWSRLDSDKASSLPSSAARATSRRVPCFARRATAAATGTLSPQKVAVVSASSSTCWLEFFDCRSFFSAPPATAVHRLLNLRVDVGLEPVGPAPQVLLPLVRLHIGLLASCQFHPAEASSHWLTLPRGGLGF